MFKIPIFKTKAPIWLGIVVLIIVGGGYPYKDIPGVRIVCIRGGRALLFPKGVGAVVIMSAKASDYNSVFC